MVNYTQEYYNDTKVIRPALMLKRAASDGSTWLWKKKHVWDVSCGDGGWYNARHSLLHQLRQPPQHYQSGGRSCSCGYAVEKALLSVAFYTEIEKTQKVFPWKHTATIVIELITVIILQWKL